MDSQLSTSTISPLSPENLIAQAIDKALPVETMEKLLAMRRELKAEYAKQEFDQAMSTFQSECPTIDKTKNGPVISGKVAYKYAPIESIVEQVKKQLEANGFSYAIQTSMAEDRIKVTCTVKHKFGHSESSDMEVPLGTKNALMSAPQQVAAAMTYAKRYAFCNAFGIMTGDEDTDAQAEPAVVSSARYSSPGTPNSAPNSPVQKSSVVEATKVCPDCKSSHTGQYPRCYTCYSRLRK